MQRTSRAIATAAVVGGLGGLAAVALSSQPNSAGGEAATATTALPPRRIVRTQVEVHTIKRVKRDLPPVQSQTARPSAPAPAPAAMPAAAPAPAPVRAQPVAQTTPPPQPLRTRASGSTGGRGDDGAEHEQGDARERRSTEHEGHGQDD